MAGNKTKKLFQFTLYILVQIVFIPFAIVGVIIGIYKGIIQSKKMGVSFTAGQALQYRWVLHYFNLRPDPFSIAFTKKLPCESHFGLWSFYGALILSQRLFGYTSWFGRLDKPGEETFVSFAGPRVIMFDRIMEKYVDKMEQIVLPGAGFDLIALHFTKGKTVRVFELDQVNTLTVKVDTLRKAGIKHDWITYIPVDYATESWDEKLLEAEFDPSKKTLFLWQSVSLYLEEDLVKETLRKMADLCGKGSIIAQDFHSKSYVSGETSKTVKRASKMIEKRGEPWKFGIDMSNDAKDAVRIFLEDCGLKMTGYTQFGEKLDLEPFYCIVEAERL